jgi:glycerate kinase
MPRFLVAPDSFKGTFDAAAVAEALAAGVEEAGAEADRCPVADGGEGTMTVLLDALAGERRVATVHDPLRRPIEASFGLFDEGETAVVEVAAASGLALLAPQERDPECGDTFGTGELIAAAVADGARRVLVAAGGSATTDGGRGALEALRQHRLLPGEGGATGRRASPESVFVEVLCDVATPYEEAAAVFAPQKGADPAAVERLTRRLHGFAAELPRDPRGEPMTGCAGGLSGGLWAYGARLRPGAAFVLDAVGFDARLAAADAVIGGEGRFDSQSLEGKIVGEIAARCTAADKPLHLVVGENALASGPPPAVASITQAESLQEMRRAALGLAGG